MRERGEGGGGRQGQGKVEGRDRGLRHVHFPEGTGGGSISGDDCHALCLIPNVNIGTRIQDILLFDSHGF